MNNELFNYRIENIKKELPDPKTYEQNEIVFSTYEVDMNSEVKPSYAKIIHLVFVKNEAKNEWILDGKYYPSLNEADPNMEV